MHFIFHSNNRNNNFTSENNLWIHSRNFSTTSPLVSAKILCDRATRMENGNRANDPLRTFCPIFVYIVACLLFNYAIPCVYRRLHPDVDPPRASLQRCTAFPTVHGKLTCLRGILRRSNIGAHSPLPWIFFTARGQRAWKKWAQRRARFKKSSSPLSYTSSARWKFLLHVDAPGRVSRPKYFSKIPYYTRGVTRL